MSTIIRGARNAFRNTVRTFSVVLILALSIGLSLVMLLSYQTVKNKIASVKGSIGNTISVTPAGAQGFQGGGEPLTEDQMAQIRGLTNVTAVAETLQDRLTTGTGTTSTNLTSNITPGTLGNRFGNRGGNGAGNGRTSTEPLTLPINVTGIADTSVVTSNGSSLTSGALFDATSSSNVAVVGSGLATKNNLSVGSTFTAYGATITVAGIFDSGNQFGNSGIYMPIKTVQTLSAQPNDVTEAVVTVNDISNVSSVVTAIQNKLGTTVADVVSNQDSANNAITPLQNIESISLYSLIGALIAGAVITLLIMMMIVRERRREIGVLKAIGGSNIGVVVQFVSESLVLTLLGAVVGIIAGTLLSNPILNVLVNNSVSTAAAIGGGRGAGFARVAGQFGGNVRGSISSLHATVGTSIILYGFLAAIAIAILGSAIPAFLIAKVKPAEAMRSE